MDFCHNLGLKIKNMRLSQKLTLAECSEMTGLSVGFLSQIENGKTSISIENLQTIAQCLDVDLNYFFVSGEKRQNIMISRTWERKSQNYAQNIVGSVIGDTEHDRNIVPLLLTINPETKWNGTQEYHNGDIFFFVVDGILNLRIGNISKKLFPGDAAHFSGKNGYAFWNESPFKTHVFFARKKLERKEKE